MAERSIIVDCERMKYPHTGLYHFCLHLGTNLLRTNADNRNLCFYVPPASGKPFGNDTCYMQQHPLQKLILPSTRNTRLWHSTYQGSKYYPWRRKLAIVLTVHDLNFIYNPNKTAIKKRAYIKRLQAKVDRADAIVAISNYTLNDLKQHIDLEEKQCAVIYNGCNITEMANLQNPAFTPSAPFLFTIGTIVEKKNFHVLPALLTNNNYQLIIAGITQSEDYKNRMIQEAIKWGVAGRIVFTGAVTENDKQWYLKNCTAFLFPSISEGFGLPVIEAMYFGKPVILSTHTSLPEVGGDAAYYFKSFDPGEMQQTLTDSLHHYETTNPRKEIQERASLFSWEKTAQQYHAVYNALL